MTLQRILFLLLWLWLAGCSSQRQADRDLQRIAFGSCADQEKAQPIWRSVVEYRPDLFVFLGDNVYADTLNPEELRTEYSKLRAKPHVQELLTNVPVLATWDDHDYGYNDSGADNPAKADAQQVFLDFFGVPDESPRRKRHGVYHAQLFGSADKRVQVIVLDTRFHRSPLLPALTPCAQTEEAVFHCHRYRPNADPLATVLGSEQWQWLAEQLRQPAALRIIVSSIQFVSPDSVFESWSNFPLERQRFLDLMRNTRPGPTIFISGDRHFGEISAKEEVGLGKLYEVTASGLNQDTDLHWRNRYRVGEGYFGVNFGTLDLSWHSEEIEVTLAIRDVFGERVSEKTLRFNAR